MYRAPDRKWGKAESDQTIENVPSETCLTMVAEAYQDSNISPPNEFQYHMHPCADVVMHSMNRIRVSSKHRLLCRSSRS